MKIEGIPDGWELVRIGSVRHGEYYLDPKGHPVMWTSAVTSHQTNYVIIRKIEKPKQYRPFANAAEAEPFFDRRLRYRSSTNAILRINVLGETGAEIAGKDYTYQQAFDRFECTDGTPFGVECEVQS